MHRSPDNDGRRGARTGAALLLACALGARAQVPSPAAPEPPPAAPAAPATAPEGDYRLGVGDVLTVVVYGEDMAPDRVPVDPSGRITFRLVGSVPAAGRTLDEVQQDLQARVSKVLRHALVLVSPAQFGSRTFTILGQVARPGTYPIEGRMGLYDALARGGGLAAGEFRNSTVDLFDLAHATLTRRGQLVPADFEALIQRGDASQDRLLESGDIIVIPSALVRNIYILGEVNYPRTVGMVSSLSLIQALTEARGLRNTASGKLLVIRGSVSRPQVTVADVPRLLAGRERDVLLAPGDIVFAPRRSLEFLDEIVRTALSGFAAGSAAEAGAGLYREASGGDGTGRPVVVP